MFKPFRPEAGQFVNCPYCWHTLCNKYIKQHETPTFFINGVHYDDSWDLGALLEAVEIAGVTRM